MLTNNVVGLTGDLGAGKTTFVQMLAKELAVSVPVVSPTFLLLKMYSFPEFKDMRNLVHLDMYRINDWSEIESLGLPEMWNDDKNLILIEWADRIKDDLPEKTQFLHFAHVDEDTRTVEY